MQYDKLKFVFDAAFAQAAEGKGKERHACGEAFEKQQIVEIAERLQGNPAAGVLFQAVKKCYESGRLPPDRAIRELHGAMVYTAAGIIIFEKFLPQIEKQTSAPTPKQTEQLSDYWQYGWRR